MYAFYSPHSISLEIPEQKRLHLWLWKFCKIVWHPLKIPRSITKANGNSISSLGNPRVEILYPQPPLPPPNPLFDFALEELNLSGKLGSAAMYKISDSPQLIWLTTGGIRTIFLSIYCEPQISIATM